MTRDNVIIMMTLVKRNERVCGQQQVCHTLWHTGRRLLTSPKRCNQQDYTCLWDRTAEDAVQERHQGCGPKAQWQLCHKDHNSLEKKVSFSSMEDPQWWSSSEWLTESPTSTRENESPGLEQTGMGTTTCLGRGTKEEWGVRLTGKTLTCI